MRPQVHDDVVHPPHALVIRVLQPARRFVLRKNSKDPLRLIPYKGRMLSTQIHKKKCPYIVSAYQIPESFIIMITIFHMSFFFF